MHQNLAPASRKEIEKRWDDAIAASSDIFDAFEKHGRDPKFRQLKHCLGNGALAFEVLRYPGRESESGFALFPLPDVLHSAIVARRPDWSIVFHPHAISIEPENNTAGDSAARNVIDNKAALDSGVFNPADIPNASITKEMEDFYAFVRAEIMAGKTVVDNKG